MGGRSLLVVFALGSIACAQVHVPADAAVVVDTFVAPADSFVAPIDTFVAADAPSACGASGFGARCATDTDCTAHVEWAAPFCMPPGRGATGGYCTSVCMTDAECGPCARCAANPIGVLPVPTWAGICVRSCDVASPCDAGYVCAVIEEGRDACFPDCRLQPGICGAARCDAATGSCALTCAVDGDCAEGSRCASGRCLCGSTTTCLAGSSCNGSTVSTEAGLCGCTSDAVCGPGHTCDTSFGCCRWGSGFCG